MVVSRMVNCRSACGTVGVVLAFAALTVSVMAADYKKISGAITDPREVNSLRREVNLIVRSGGALNKADEATLKKYYLYHVLAGMSQDEALSNPDLFPGWRKAVVGDLESMGGTRQKHDYVRTLVLGAAQKHRAESSIQPGVSLQHVAVSRRTQRARSPRGRS